MKIERIKIGKRFRKDIGDLESLKNSIKEIGLLHPVVVDEKSNLIAGFRRLEAFKELGKNVIPVNVVNIENLIKGEFDENSVRKDFATTEAVAIWGALESRQGERTDLGANGAEVKGKKAAKITKYSERTLSRAKAVIEYGNKKWIEEMDRTGNVNNAYKKIKSAKRKKEKIKKYEIASKNFKESDIKICNDDFMKVAEQLDGESVDLILTDPPYPEEFLPLWEQLFEVADKLLKPSKFLVCYANHQNLDKIFRLKNNLIYYWTFKLDFTLKPIAKGRNLIATWKPVLIFQKPPFKKIQQTIEDNVKELKPFKNSERDMHEDNWGQSIGKVEWLMENFSEAGDTVFEPFAGTGTTLIAAKNLKRKCVGVELEEKYIKLIKGRLV